MELYCVRGGPTLLLRRFFQITMVQSLEALEFPSVCEGASSLEESSVL